ncbi:hypothetical protein PCE1_002303 [Barthelona sp. PCE]
MGKRGHTVKKADTTKMVAVKDEDEVPQKTAIQQFDNQVLCMMSEGNRVVSNAILDQLVAKHASLRNVIKPDDFSTRSRLQMRINTNLKRSEKALRRFIREQESDGKIKPATEKSELVMDIRPTPDGRKRTANGRTPSLNTGSSRVQTFVQEIPSERLSDVAGLDIIYDQLVDEVIIPLSFGTDFNEEHQSSHGVIFCGPSGCGKTFLARSVVGEIGSVFENLTYFEIIGSELVSGISGGSEAMLRDVFTMAKESAPSIIFIDEFDTIAPKKATADKDMSRRIVSQLGTLMDSLKNEQVFVIATTNTIDTIDVTLRRPGRFESEIALGIPNEHARQSILEKLVSEMPVSDDVNLRKLSILTPGFVGADLFSLCKGAIKSAKRRRYELNVGVAPDVALKILVSGEPVDETVNSVSMEDFVSAVKTIQPAMLREGFTTVANVSFDDIGGLEDVKKQLIKYVLLPITKPQVYEHFNRKPSSGVLLYGPPGCGKTLLAKAISAQAGANFISVKGPEVFNQYFGESERIVRQLFQRARASQPCVIFFDEIDSLCKQREQGRNSPADRVVNQLLTEMDGLVSRGRVFIIAATNRPSLIDAAILRPGRIGSKVYVPLPDDVQRHDILLKMTNKLPLDNSVDIESIGKCTEGYSGADLAQLIHNATDFCIDEERDSVLQSDFERAFEGMHPSVSDDQLQEYIDIADGF